MSSPHNIQKVLHQARPAVDPGDADTITVDRSPHVVELVSLTAETRTLARPTKAGAICLLYMKTDGGDITLTVTGGFNEDAETSFVFSDAGQFLLLVSIQVGTSYTWRKVSDHSIGNIAAATLAILDGVTADAAEINVLDGATAGTSVASKALVFGTTRDIGSFRMTGKLFTPQAAPETSADTASLTDAQMLSGILVATPTAAAAYTVRTGTQLEAALLTAGFQVQNGDTFDLTIINIGGTGDDITLTAATGITIVGDAVVRPSADSGTEQAGQGTFRFRRTAANTFVAYRVS